MKKVGIVGGAGYTAGELIRLLLRHDKVTIDFIFSTSSAGKSVSHIHQDLIGETDLQFTANINVDVDVVFLCLGHGNSKKILEANKFSTYTRIIDLSNDFRLKKDATFQNKSFIYGLPELYKSSIIDTKYIANPGCFATAIQLALLPLAEVGLLEGDIHVNATTGSTGAGVSLSPTSHFSWRDSNFSSYKVFSHQHLGEINETLHRLQPDFSNKVLFIPNRGNFSRGIFVSSYFKFDGDLQEVKNLYEKFYKDATFTFLSDEGIHLKQVINTNKCLITVHKIQNQLLIMSTIDNLLKGASGQAVQNMNLMFGFEEDMGLKLKPIAF